MDRVRHVALGDHLPELHDADVVELAEQKHLKMVSNVVDIDPDEVRIGMAVEVVFTQVAPGVTLPRFKVVAARYGLDSGHVTLLT